MSLLGITDISTLTDGQQFLLCVLFSAVSAFFDTLSDGPNRLNPFSSFQSMFGGALLGALVFFLTVEVDNIKPSYRIAVAILVGLAWRRIIMYIRSGDMLSWFLSRWVGGVAPPADRNNKNGKDRKDKREG